MATAGKRPRRRQTTAAIVAPVGTTPTLASYRPTGPSLRRSNRISGTRVGDTRTVMAKARGLPSTMRIGINGPNLPEKADSRLGRATTKAMDAKVRKAKGSKIKVQQDRRATFQPKAQPKVFHQNLLGDLHCRVCLPCHPCHLLLPHIRSPRSCRL